MDIISRSAAGLPSPSALSRKTTPWAGITWHHTGGGATTWKAIHDWQTSGRPAGDRLAYIGYSYGIGVDGRVTELRGWDYRAAGDHENSRLQVCFMGNWASKLPPPAALNAALEFARYAQQRAGKAMPGVAHRDVWSGGQYDTDCPGNALYAWVRANLTTIRAGEEDDMFTEAAEKKLNALFAFTFTGGPDCGPKVDPEYIVNRGNNPVVAEYANSQVCQLNQIRGDLKKVLAALESPDSGMSPEQLAALGADITDRLGSLRFVATDPE